ncbi:MAG: endonuclease III [Bacillota bacterium]|nr:endonuclease III [Bacillota bacterium]
MPVQGNAAPPSGSGPDEAELVRTAGQLRAAHAVGPPDLSGRPVDELVAAILSQHTSDHNSHRAFAALKRRYPRWSQVLDADAGEVADVIRCGGLADQKAPRIMALVRELPRDAGGEPTLDHLAGMEPHQAHSYLTSFAGVGPKTAACALLFAYGWPTFPVDTHVHRVARRLGWAEDRDTAEKVFEILSVCVPDYLTYDLHVGLVRHGRGVCRPRDPRCHACDLQDRCAYRAKIAGRHDDGGAVI